jgi:uncharacterized protein YdbL (DUF1318 family)
MKRAFLVAFLLCSCVKAPTVVVVDKNTALMEQIGMNAPQKEKGLVDEALSPIPEPITSAEMSRSSVDVSQTSVQEILKAYQSLKTDMPLVEALLVRGCLGEALDGFLVELPCEGELQASAIAPIVQRINRDRRQIWAFMQARSDGATEEQVRHAWRKRWIEGLVCNAKVQMEDGSWGVKKCEK